MNCPAVLAEQCFVTNEADAARFGSEEGCKKAARIYYEAICEYFGTQPQSEQLAGLSLNWTKRDVPAERSCSRRCTHKRVSELESGRERRSAFLITYISYNARYVKYRGVKKASFLRFGFFGSLWTFRWLQCCFIGFLQFFIVWCISFAFYCYNSFSESFSITGFTGRTCIRFLRTVFFFRHTSFIMVSVLEPFWSFYFSVHDHSFVLF